jgi:hypothetical protein
MELLLVFLNNYYIINNKLLLHFEKYIINKVTLLIIAFFDFTTSTFAQGATCATAETLVINGACDTGATITDTTQNTPNATGCSFNTFQREG